MSRELDAYIARAQPYARPILERMRALFHRACPDIVEVLKWGHPTFEYRGIVGGMAAFNQHIRFRFWKGSLLRDPDRVLRDADGNAGAMNMTDISKLPSDKVLLDFIRQAIELNQTGAKIPRAGAARGKAVALAVPDDLAAALRKNSRAQRTFEAMAASQRNEYVEWLVEAKQEATRKKRLVTAIEWLVEGKSRNWKYERPK